MLLDLVSGQECPFIRAKRHADWDSPDPNARTSMRFAMFGIWLRLGFATFCANQDQPTFSALREW